MPSQLRLIFRGDDAGSARSANLALRECCEHGVVRNVGVMVPGPAFDHAVELFADPPAGCGLGLHVTLSAEWDAPRWGPVLPASQVPSLVDAQGNFTAEPNMLRERGFSLGEALAEIEAQLDRALAAGLRLEYIDEHMAVSWIDPGLRAGIAALAWCRGLVDACAVPGLPDAPGHGTDPVAGWIARLEHAAAQGGGTFVVVTHPACDDAEMRAYTGAGHPPGQLARERDLDRRSLLDPRLRDACRRLGIQITHYGGAAGR